MATVHFLGRDGYVELPAAKLRPTAHISLQVGLTFDLCAFIFVFQGLQIQQSAFILKQTQKCKRYILQHSS